MSSQSSPHDAVFRRILGEPANAASQLRAVLPASLVKQLDLDRLRPVPGSFVDSDLEWRHTDLLFTAPMQDRQAFIYVLVEHQSSTDPLMPFRMLRYLVRIWDRWLADHPNATILPAVIPLVVHHNRSPWNSPTQLLDLLDLDPDTTGNPRLAEDLVSWVDDLRAVLHQPGGLEQFKALLRYIEVVGEARADELEDLVTQLGPEAEEAYVTLPQDVLDTVHGASTDQLEAWTARVLTAGTLHEALR